jgi:hypothetical protein
MNTIIFRAKRVLLLLSVALFPAAIVQAQNELENANVFSVGLHARDVVYDTKRDVLYASISSSAGFPNGNSIAVISPDDLEVIEYIPIGSEPNRLALLPDDDLLWVGVDGAAGIRWLRLSDYSVGPIFPTSGYLGAAGVAQSIAIDPANSNRVVVSCNAIGSSATGNLRVFDLAGEISSNFYVYGPTSIAFVSPMMMSGSHDYSSGIEFYRFSFDGNRLVEEDQRRNVFFAQSIKVSGDRVYSSWGQVADPNTLSLLGNFQLGPHTRGAFEVSRLSGLAYFLINQQIRVYDTETFLLRDSLTLDEPFVTDGRSGMVAAGSDRLAFVDKRGHVGVISEVPFIPNPSPKMTIECTEGDDIVWYNSNIRSLVVNGQSIPLPPEVVKLTIDGLGGNDKITIRGLNNHPDFVVMSESQTSVQNPMGFVHALNFEDVQFLGIDSTDEVVINDTPGNDRIVAFPGSCHLIGESVYLRASARTIWVNGSTGMDTAGYYGQFDTVRVAANLETNVLRITEGPNFLQIRVFDGSVSFGGQANNDTAVMIDSKLNDVAAMRPDYTRFFNANCDHRVRNFESVTLNAINGGNDRVTLYRPSGASLFQNATQATVIGPGFRNSARNFKRVNVIDD